MVPPVVVVVVPPDEPPVAVVPAGVVVSWPLPAAAVAESPVAVLLPDEPFDELAPWFSIVPGTPWLLFCVNANASSLLTRRLLPLAINGFVCVRSRIALRSDARNANIPTNTNINSNEAPKGTE